MSFSNATEVWDAINNAASVEDIIDVLKQANIDDNKRVGCGEARTASFQNMTPNKNILTVYRRFKFPGATWFY